MADPLPPVYQRFLDKFSKSRDFTISFFIHAVLVLIFGSTILIQVVKEPDPIVTTIIRTNEAPRPPEPPKPIDQVAKPDILAQSPPSSSGPIIVIKTNRPDVEISLPDIGNPTEPVGPPSPDNPVVQTPSTPAPGEMTKGDAEAIRKFAIWVKNPSRSGGSVEAEFTAYIGQYQGGNWSSTIRIDPDGKIGTGSLPNLLYLMSFWSKEKLKTNYKNVQAIRLDSGELFTVKPPFIFLTGTEDFVLTDKEVANLQQYIRVGGCIWGDSSVPGLRSRFDLAFRREMKRVIPDIDQQFEPLPVDHPLFTKAYFPQVKQVPAGLNFYQLPVYAMKKYGEIAILYTANDYGDMWQLGLDSKGQIDLRTDSLRRYVAINPSLYGLRDIYVRNMTADSLALSYKFGTNLVIHLLTRWDDKVNRVLGPAAL